MKYTRKTFLDREEQKKIIQLCSKERAYVEGKIPITGRSIENYSIQLFPDIDQSKLLKSLLDKDYLDVACGINHLYKDSLLYKLKGTKKRHGLDIHSSNSVHKNIKYFKGSIYDINFPKNSYDCITINNYMYFWESNPHKLLKMYKELYKFILVIVVFRVSLSPNLISNFSLFAIKLFNSFLLNFIVNLTTD